MIGGGLWLPRKPPYSFSLMTDDGILIDEISEIDAQIEELAESAERSRRIILGSKVPGHRAFEAREPGEALGRDAEFGGKRCSSSLLHPACCARRRSTAPPAPSSAATARRGRAGRCRARHGAREQPAPPAW